MYGDVGQSNEAFAIIAEMVARFGEEPDPSLRAWAAKALFLRGALFGRLGRQDDKVASYNEIVGRFGDEGDATLREVVARARRRIGLESLIRSALAQAQTALGA